ncbi:MAG TPA: protein kinase, partial [Iamia sp.]
QMCDALGAAHQAGILHRDIKPANVLTSRIGDYKLADFGIARFGDTQRTATGVITGTVAYTAPEVLRGARASAASDIYALGAMLCAVTTGKTPFVKEADESVVAIMYRVNTEDPPPFDGFDVPDDLGLLIHTLMDKDPEKRPASALEVAQWAQHIQEQHGIASAPLHPDPDMEPGLPAAAIAAGAAAVGAGAAAAAAPAPAAPTSTPPPQTDAYGQPTGYPSATPPPQQAWGQGTPAPQTAYGQPSYGGPTGGYDPATGYAQAPATGAYGPQSGAYGYGQQPPAESGGAVKVILIAAVIALVFVAVIIAIAAVAGGGESSSDGGTTTTEARATTTSGAESPTTTVVASTEVVPTTTEATTTTEAPTTTTGDGGFTEATRQSFIDSCVGGGGTEAQCTCIVDELDEVYTEEELAALNEETSAGSLPPELEGIVLGCA